MNRIILTSLLLLFLSSSDAYSQQGFNASLVDHRNDFSDLKYADVWGFTQPDGTEYAAIGTRRGVAIYQISLNGELELLQHIQGDYSPWRDIKSYGDYLYAIDDSGNDGLMIINMQQAPRAITWTFWRPEITIGEERKFLDNCHNLWIDEKGMLYLAGCNLNDGGILIADLSEDPGQPVFAGAADPAYAHDCYAANDQLWTADLWDGGFGVHDVSDKQAPLRIASEKTGARFTHNVWLSDDQRYLFTTDEVANAAVEAYDVRDLNNIQRLDDYRPAASLGSGVIPHNVHYYRGWLVVSYYTDGVKIIDAHRPENLVEVGSYDTWAGADGGYRGCWGAFPFLSSGFILTSNIEDGLRVLRPKYRRACYLEGEITDAHTGGRLNNVRVRILSDQANLALSDLRGEYKTGQFYSGSFEVEFIREGYEKKKATIELQNGEVTLLNIALTPLQSYRLTGRLLDAESGEVIPNATIILRNDLSYFEGQTDDRGAFSINGVYNENYRVFAAAWGYRYLEVDRLIIDQSGPYELEMERGYQDDFLFDLGWVSESDASVTTGFWEWGEPKGTTSSGTAANPFDDLPNDFGDHCYVTGNRGGNPNRDDVDGGTVRLLSPPMDLTGYQDPRLTYHLWFFNSLEGGDDSLKVFLSNGAEKVLIDQLTEPASAWRARSDVRVLDYLPLSSEMYFILETADQPDRDHVVEAALDGFMVVESDPATPTESLPPPEVVVWQVFPNPARGPITLDYQPPEAAGSLDIQIFDEAGRLVWQTPLAPSSSEQIAIQAMPAPGVYFIRLRIDGRATAPRKIVWMP